MRAPKELLAAAGRGPEPLMTDPRACDIAQLPDAQGVYNENAFRYFLEIERRRSSVSGESFLLLVIDLDGEAGEAIPPRVAAKVFAALSASLRDTDFVGWYAAEHAIGAVLIQAVDLSKVDAVGSVRARVSKTFASQLPNPVIGRLRIQVCQVRSDREIWS